jgi:hypothetical protein
MKCKIDSSYFFHINGGLAPAACCITSNSKEAQANRIKLKRILSRLLNKDCSIICTPSVPVYKATLVFETNFDL